MDCSICSLSASGSARMSLVFRFARERRSRKQRGTYAPRAAM
jgi:hypothetical protein